MIITRRGFLKGIAGGLASVAVPQLVTGAPSPVPNLFVDEEHKVSMISLSGKPPWWEGPWDKVCDGLFYYDWNRRIITYVGKTGFSLKDMYGNAKEQWRDNEMLRRFEFPLSMITPEFGSLQGGWNVNPSSWDWMRVGCCVSEDEQVKMVAIIGLGNIDDPTPPAYIQNAELAEVEKVNPWNHTVRVTNDVHFLRWRMLEPEYLYYEFVSNQAGYPKGPDFLHSMTGSLRVPFILARDLYYEG